MSSTYFLSDFEMFIIIIIIIIIIFVGSAGCVAFRGVPTERHPYQHCTLWFMALDTLEFRRDAR